MAEVGYTRLINLEEIELTVMIQKPQENPWSSHLGRAT
jgi:hypothetical protein